MSKICTDHLGNKYNSKKLMCEFYKIPVDVYDQRINRGWFQKDALTRNVKSHSNICFDHLGNKYPSKEAMYETYGVTKETFWMREQRGCTLEECLTSNFKRGTKSDIEKDKGEVFDHLGNSYYSIDVMCKVYGVKRNTYYQRKRRGYSLEECLVGKSKKNNNIRTKSNLDFSTNKPLILIGKKIC